MHVMDTILEDFKRCSIAVDQDIKPFKHSQLRA